ncbi:hypothetical protein C9J85_18215 [Haloferax sp. wsp5]|nr:hypothetical protein C9J85_18215 [Haloferax sp. wsp5]
MGVHGELNEHTAVTVSVYAWSELRVGHRASRWSTQLRLVRRHSNRSREIMEPRPYGLGRRRRFADNYDKHNSVIIMVLQAIFISTMSKYGRSKRRVSERAHETKIQTRGSSVPSVSRLYPGFTSWVYHNWNHETALCQSSTPSHHYSTRSASILVLINQRCTTPATNDLLSSSQTERRHRGEPHSVVLGATDSLSDSRCSFRRPPSAFSGLPTSWATRSADALEPETVSPASRPVEKSKINR